MTVHVIRQPSVIEIIGNLTRQGESAKFHPCAETIIQREWAAVEIGSQLIVIVSCGESAIE